MQHPGIATDFAMPSGLPTASIRSNRHRNPNDTVDSDKYLEQMEEEWNRKVDAQVEILVQNMEDLIDAKDPYRVSQEAFQVELRAESMDMAASSLLSLTHSLKLMLLLSDEREIAQRRDEELHKLRKEINDAKARAIELWGELNATEPQPPLPGVP